MLVFGWRIIWVLIFEEESDGILMNWVRGLNVGDLGFQADLGLGYKAGDKMGLGLESGLGFSFFIFMKNIELWFSNGRRLVDLGLVSTKRYPK